MLFEEETDEESCFLRCRSITKSRAENEIETRSILTDEDIKRLQQLKEVKVRGRSVEWNERRKKLIDCLLDNGATSIFFDTFVSCWPKLLPDLLSYVPRDIVRRWIQQAKTSIKQDGCCGDGDDLIYRIYAGFHPEPNAMLLMFDYGANYQAKSDRGIELSDCNGFNTTLFMICRAFAAVEAEYSDNLSYFHHLSDGCSLNEFLACVHARNAQGQTILQVALHRGYMDTLEDIVSWIIHKIPPSYVLELSETMSYDELIDATKLRLNELKKGLERLIDEGNEENIVEMTLPIFETAGQVLKLWRKYEAGMDVFYGQVHLEIVEETLEALGFDVDCLSAPSFSEERVARYYAHWRRNNEKTVCAMKDIVVRVVQVAFVTPIEAFLSAIYGAKLHEAMELADVDAAAEWIRQGAMVNMLVRKTGEKDKTLLEDAIHRGDEAIATLLLDNKAEPRLRRSTKTLLHVAVEQGSCAIVEALLRNFDEIQINQYVNKRAFWGDSALRSAAQSSRFDIVKCLLTYQANFREGKCNNSRYDNPITFSCPDRRIRNFFRLIDRLFASASKGDVECLRLLKDLPRDELVAACNACDEDGHNLAQIARINKHSYIASEISRLLLAAACTNDKMSNRDEVAY